MERRERLRRLIAAQEAEQIELPQVGQIVVDSLVELQVSAITWVVGCYNFTGLQLCTVAC